MGNPSRNGGCNCSIHNCTQPKLVPVWAAECETLIEKFWAAGKVDYYPRAFRGISPQSWSSAEHVHIS